MTVSCPVLAKNQTPIDRIIRVVSGTILVALSAIYFTDTLQTLTFILGIGLMVTGSIGYCGIYAMWNRMSKSHTHTPHE